MIDLQRYCFTDDYVRRSDIEMPFRVEVDGAMWAVATDGRMVVAIPSQAEHEGLRFVEPEPRGAGAVHEFIRLCTVRAPIIALADIRRWAGVAPATLGEPQEHEAGLFGRQQVHRPRLAYLLHGLPGETVHVWSPVDHEQPITFVGDGWRAVLMPLRWKVLPTFDIPMAEPTDSPAP